MTAQCVMGQHVAMTVCDPTTALVFPTCKAVCSYSQDECFKNNMHLQRKESSDWKQISEAPAAVENTYMKGRAPAYIDHKLMSSSSINM